MKPDASAVKQALALLLEDRYFTCGPKSTAFMSYVVSQTLNGEGDRIKAYNIAVDALNAPESFDPQIDPSVRVMAFRIRAALDRYNARPNAASVVITMERGSYKPIFTTKQTEKNRPLTLLSG